MYENGKGVAKDYTYKKSFEWYRLAAEQGYMPAQLNLGIMYKNGKGVPKDKHKAYQWWLKARKQDIQRARDNLETSYQDILKNGSVEIQYYLADLYDWHYNKKYRAMELYEKAAEKGNIEAFYDIGVIYNNKEQNILFNHKKTAAKFWTKASKQGHAKSQYKLGIAYENGSGVSQDYKQAFKWYTKSDNNGYAPANVMLGNLYCKGLGVDKDLAKARDLLEFVYGADGVNSNYISRVWEKCGFAS